MIRGVPFFQNEFSWLEGQEINKWKSGQKFQIWRGFHEDNLLTFHFFWPNWTFLWKDLWFNEIMRCKPKADLDRLMGNMCELLMQWFHDLRLDELSLANSKNIHFSSAAWIEFRWFIWFSLQKTQALLLAGYWKSVITIKNWPNPTCNFWGIVIPSSKQNGKSVDSVKLMRCKLERFWIAKWQDIVWEGTNPFLFLWSKSVLLRLQKDTFCRGNTRKAEFCFLVGCGLEKPLLSVHCSE